MARVPVIDPSNNQLTTESPTAAVDVNAASTGGKNLSSIGKTIQQVSGELQVATDFVEKTEANNVLAAKLLDINSRAERDPDTSDFKRALYHDEISLAVKDSSTKISLPGQRGRYTAEANADAIITGSKVDHSFNRRRVDHGKAAHSIYLDNLRKDFLNTDDPVILNNIALRRDRSYDSAAFSGFSTFEEATNSKIKASKDWMVDHINHNASTSPEWVKGELERGNDGLYAGLSNELRQQGIDISNKMIKKQQQDYKDAVEVDYENNAASFSKRFSSGDIPTLDELEKARIAGAGGQPGGIKESSYKIFFEAVTEPKSQSTKEEKAKSLSSVAQSFFSIDSNLDNEVDKNASFDKVIEYRARVFKAHRIGAMTDTQLGAALENTEKIYQGGVGGTLTDNYKNGVKSWKYMNDWLGRAFSDKQSKAEFDQARSYFGTALLEVMAKQEITSENLPTISKQIISDYLRSTKPQLVDKEDLPNSTYSPEKGISKVYGGKTTLKPNRSIKQEPFDPAKYKINDVVNINGALYKITSNDPNDPNYLTQVKDAES